MSSLECWSKKSRLFHTKLLPTRVLCFGKIGEKIGSGLGKKLLYIPHVASLAFFQTKSKFCEQLATKTIFEFEAEEIK